MHIQGEIEQVLSLNVTPDRIIYANPCKTRSYVKHAKTRDVNLMTFDSELELKKIADLYPECRLILRIKVDDSQSVCKFSSKFGASIDDAFNLLHLAQKLNLNIVGVSFHVGSGCESAYAFEKAIEVSLLSRFSFRKFFSFLIFSHLSYDQLFAKLTPL